jgi:hypothetical protein
MTVTPVTGKSIPANDLILTESKKLTATVQSAIDIIRTHWTSSPFLTLNAGQKYYHETQTGHYDPTASGQRVLEIDSHFNYRPSPVQPTQIDDATHTTWNELVLRLGVTTADLVDDVNGKFLMPALRYDFRRQSTGDTELDHLLLDTKDRAVPLYFPGSLFDQLPNVGPQHQLVGGTTTWNGKVTGSNLDAGWTVDMVLAPATGAGTPVTIDALVTNTTPLMDAFDPALYIDSLGAVTIGLA